MVRVKCQVRAQHAGKMRKGQDVSAQGPPCAHNFLSGAGNSPRLGRPPPKPDDAGNAFGCSTKEKEERLHCRG